MPTFTFTLPGPPIPAARPKFTRRGFTYDPQAERKKASKIIIASQWNDEPLDEPLCVSIRFMMKIPESFSKKKRALCIGKPHIVKPDCDNLAKYVLDILSGKIYRDDCVIHALEVFKEYSEEPKTLITISNVA